MDAAFTGSGFAYPWGVSPQGGMRMVTGYENVERSMRLILGTAYGERPMRPEFGCAIHDMLFEPGTLDLLSRIQVEVTDSLTRWETRAEILDVKAVFDDDPSRVLITITYQLKGTYDPRNLLVPFYVIPTEVEP
ncbi:MAG: GPW/gp25 family protein [Actinobacteria bacterium]|nr:GPW/gp25 family protein [Actinomycetota bacterium]